MIRSFRASSASLAAGASLTLTPANFTIAPEDVAYVRVISLSGGILAGGIRVNVVSDERPAGVDVYPVGGIMFPVYYDERRGLFVSTIEINGRAIITATNDSGGAITNVFVAALIEIMEKAQNTL